MPARRWAARRYTGSDPHQLRFERGRHGKPHLARYQAAAAGGLQFNLSHTRSLYGARGCVLAASSLCTLCHAQTRGVSCLSAEPLGSTTRGGLGVTRARARTVRGFIQQGDVSLVLFVCV